MKIEGFFSRIKNANEAVEKLKSAGITSYSDINDHYMSTINTETKFPGNENAPSLSDLVLSSTNSGDFTDKAPLAAASPMVSGMGNFEEVMDINYRVVANVDDNNKALASEIIKSMGGDLQSPNLDLPNRIKDIDLQNIKISDLDL
jgi:hypothetical protein